MMTSPSPVLSSRAQFSPLSAAVEVDMIEGQKLGISLATASAFAATICLKRLDSKLQVLILQQRLLIWKRPFGLHSQSLAIRRALLKLLTQKTAEPKAPLSGTA
jgi:hypothetical protein